MPTLDEMLILDLLTPAQHAELRAWMRGHKTPEQILDMPPHLWRAVQLASEQMGLDTDLLAMQ